MLKHVHLYTTALKQIFKVMDLLNQANPKCEIFL